MIAVITHYGKNGFHDHDNLTHAVEDYLKTIYDLTHDGERASTNQIAERMGVTAASASGMVQKLAATTPPLLEYEKHHGVTLTVDGEKIALEIIRYHRLLELFLQETLGFSWDQVRAEADRLEHVISPDVAERISQVLGEPVHDPHGHPIPTQLKASAGGPRPTYSGFTARSAGLHPSRGRR